MGHVGEKARRSREIKASNNSKVIATMTKRRVRLIVIGANDVAEAHLDRKAVDRLIHRLSLFRERLKDD